MKVSVSYLKSPYSVAETILKLNETSCDFLHVDLMDGVFAGTNNYDQESVFQELHLSTKPLDIHLMMVNPAGVIQTLASLHPSYITIPVEILQDDQLISLVKSYGIKCGLALNPDTPIESLIPFLDKIDYFKSSDDFHIMYLTQSIFIISVFNSILIAAISLSLANQSLKFDVLFIPNFKRKAICLCKLIAGSIFVSVSYTHLTLPTT